VRNGADITEYARAYYLGMQLQDTPPEWTKWKLYTSVVSDVISITATIITVYQACTLPEFDARRDFGLGLWVYPSLPVSLIGLCLLAGNRLFGKTRHPGWWLFLFTLFVLTAVGAGIAVVLWKFDGGGKGSEMWYISVIFYGLMCFPVSYFFVGPFAFLVAIWCLAAWYARVGGVSIAALRHYSGGQPYCHLKGLGFGAFYMTLGGIATALALGGCFFHMYPFKNRTELKQRWAKFGMAF
jgi:hypothetical protein